MSLCLFVVQAGVPLVSGAASVPRPLVRVGHVAALTFVAGDRYVVAARRYGLDARSFEVIDTKLRRARTQVYPAGCRFGASPSLPSVLDRLLLQCPSGSAIMDLRDGHLIAEGLVDGGPLNGWLAMGKEWLSIPNRFLNIRTGEVRNLDPSDSPSHLRDLDDPNLAPLTFCSPFEAEPRFPDQQQADGYVTSRPVSPDGVLKLALGRCGSGAKPKLLSNELAVSDMSAARGFVAWASPKTKWVRDNCARRAFAYDLARKRTTRWPTLTKRCVHTVMHTKYAVVVGQSAAVQDDEGSAPGALVNLLIAPLPR